MKASIVLLSGLAAQHVSATWNRGAGHFRSPQYNNNECNDKQKEGFNWGDLPKGSFSQYGDFDFTGGWTCADSFGKRDSLTKRTFGSKCIKNKVKKDKPASFGCNKRKEGFSIKEFQVSVEYDAEIEIHYKMPDNSICKQISPCSKEGTVIQNTQCGGARSVDVYLGKHKQQGREDCEIGFHNIGFDCNPGYTPTPKPSTTPEAPSSTPEAPLSTPEAESSTATPEVPPESKTTEAGNTPPPQSTLATAPIYGNSSRPVETPVTPPETTVPAVESSSGDVPAPPASTPVEMTTSVVYSTLTSTVTSCAEQVTNCPADQASTVVVTSEVIVGTTVCPVTPTGGANPPASKTPEASVPQPTGPAPSNPPASENPGYTPPDVLPKCMNTWLELKSECKDNTDSNCYCKNPDFTKSVIECVAAWASDEETQKGLQYLIGICAPYVPQNPGLITDCPSNIPINPTGPATPPPAATTAVESGAVPPTTPAPSAGAPPAGPVTTITYQTTAMVPCSCGSEGSSTMSTISTTITVPQVVFTTETPAQPPAPGVTPSEQPVALVPGTPAPVPAVTTGAPYPVPSASSPSNFGTITVPAGNATASFTAPPEFTGAASAVSLSFKTSLLGLVLAFFAL